MTVKEINDVGVIGGGISGLTVAYELAKRGYSVRLFERESAIGGLARSAVMAGAELERYYHFICKHDDALLDFIRELGLETELRWRRTAMDYHVEGKLYPFTDPQDLLKFKPLTVWNRIRFALSMIPFQFRIDWTKLDDVPNDEWLIRWGGQQVYERIWKPLMVKKYHHVHRKIPAAWVWGRTRRRNRSREGFPGHEVLGYIEGGTRTLLLRLIEKTESMGGKFALDFPVKSIRKEGENFDLSDGKKHYLCRKVISTLPAPALAELPDVFSENFRQRLKDQKYLCVICPVIAVEGNLARQYWTNIYEVEIPYLGIIEYSRLNPDPAFQGKKVAYLPFYVWPEDELWKASDEEIIDLVLEHLGTIFPWFERKQMLDYLIHRDRFSQPVIETGHLKRIFSFRTPVDNIFMLDASMIYPEDRGLNNCIRVAQRLTQELF